MAIDTEGYRKRLLEERERLELERNALDESESMSEELGELTDYDINHPGDIGTEVFEREKEAALEANVQRVLRQVDEALARIEAGTYGKCLQCGRPIAEERLRALPYAAFCIACQTALER
ncbi:MAG: TraR/DksA C4-type zinc finger protein [Chthonomonadales bacterium]|nr:TraR/DksA C4-type zinc finger protein [Chthonomonadales bacterium]